jgi:hypothetical protein
MPARKYRNFASLVVVIALLVFGSLIFSRHLQVASQTQAPANPPAAPPAQLRHPRASFRPARSSSRPKRPPRLFPSPANISMSPLL